MTDAAPTGDADHAHSPSPFQGESEAENVTQAPPPAAGTARPGKTGRGTPDARTQAPVPAPGTSAAGEDAPLTPALSPEGRGGDGPTPRSRAVALVALPVLVLGAALLAHTLAGDLIRGEPADRLGSRSGLEVSPGSGDPSAVRAPAAGAPPAGMTGREWAEALAGGDHDDPIGPPPGAKRLFRMAGGYTFYRLPAGPPAERIREAVDHYRRALADAGWETFVDRASGKGVGPRDAEASDGVSGSASRPMTTSRRSRPATGHLIIAERDGRTVHVFVHERQGTARVVVRAEPNR